MEKLKKELIELIRNNFTDIKFDDDRLVTVYKLENTYDYFNSKKYKCVLLVLFFDGINNNWISAMDLTGSIKQDIDELEETTLNKVLEIAKSIINENN